MDNEYIAKAKRYRKKGPQSERFKTFYYQSALSNPSFFSDFCRLVENDNGNVVSFIKKESHNRLIRNLELFDKIEHKRKKEIRV
jgi:hypothetical protein